MAALNRDFTTFSAENPISNSGEWTSGFGAGVRTVDNGGSVNARVGSANTYQGSHIATASGTYSSTKQFAGITIGANTGTNDSLGPATFMSGDNCYYLSILGIGTSSSNRIFKNVAGTKTDLWWTGGVTISIGDRIGLLTEHSGGTTTLTFYRNWTLGSVDGDGFPTDGSVTSTTDTSLSSGQAGMVGVANNSRAAYATNFYSAGFTAAAAGPSITNVDTDNTIDDEQDDVTVNGTGFGATQGDSTLTLDGFTVTAKTWSDTAITFDKVASSHKFGAQDLVVTVDASPATQEITINPPANTEYIDLTNVDATDVETSPALEVGDQINYDDETNNAEAIDIDASGLLTVTSDDPTGSTFRARVWDGTEWGAWQTLTINEDGSASVAGSSARLLIGIGIGI